MTKSLLRPLLTIVLLMCISTVSAKTIKGKVTAVKDGDTIVVLQNRNIYTVRLEGVDCPEQHQAFGQRAKQFTSAQVFGKSVTVEYHGKDQYKRILGKVYYNKTKNLDQELLKAGLAWHYKHYNHDFKLADLENTARSKRLGLWADKKPVPPWEYRHRK